MILQAVVVIESVWLATIYGNRFFDALDRAQARFKAIEEEDYYHYEEDMNKDY